MAVRLRDATATRLHVPLDGRYSASVHEGLDEITSALVVLDHPTGERGIGTADPSPGYSRQTAAAITDELDAFLPTLVDDPPSNANALRARAADALGPNATLAVETAFLDLYGRLHDIDIVDLLGGARRRTEPLNAWVGIDTPDTMAATAQTWHDRGFDSCKLKLSGDPDRDVARVRRVLDAVDDMAVRADANGAYDFDGASSVARALEGSGLVHLEQPVPQEEIDALASLTAETDLPVMADEPVTDHASLFEILARDAADRVKLKTLRLGGLAACRSAIDIAAAADVAPVVGHGFCLSPAAAAEIAVTTTTGPDDLFRPVETVGPLKMADEPFEPRLRMDDGSVRLPDGPGLGVRLDDTLSEFTD